MWLEGEESRVITLEGKPTIAIEFKVLILHDTAVTFSLSMPENNFSTTAHGGIYQDVY